MKISVRELKAIIAEELSSARGRTRGSTAVDAKTYLGMAQSSVSPEQVGVWKDNEVDQLATSRVQRSQDKAREMAALKKRIEDLKKAQLDAMKRYRELSSGV